MWSKRKANSCTYIESTFQAMLLVCISVNIWESCVLPTGGVHSERCTHKVSQVPRETPRRSLTSAQLAVALLSFSLSFATTIWATSTQYFLSPTSWLLRPQLLVSPKAQTHPPLTPASKPTSQPTTCPYRPNGSPPTIPLSKPTRPKSLK